MHGQGVFATERIPAGTLVCVYRGEPISSEEADRRSRARPPGAPVFVFEIDENFCIDATDTGTENPARFINHACDENCETAWNPRERRLEIRALRDLAAGEELSIDYGFGLAGFFANVRGHFGYGDIRTGTIVANNEEREVRAVLLLNKI